ncbi:putative bifunctional diguanylate cyclase/phosphodiesterase [Sulfuriferula nivalis]|uniref:Diguanylate cyclase/phosphodiesterase n=1 Tax=Sulfuriferula nivalis TaxID=2675298 RepID=A0A809SC86_9PROT|nr:EAL domain-containing protein [Sulfuriferula nivalis]BBO99726.1 hypothetical protein SFSGTM_04350 [Sulfuriferula nivalis]
MDRTLLLVDDEDNVIASLVRLLRQDGYRVLTANSGKAALEVLATHSVGVILTDQRMPEMTGVTLLEKARDAYPETVRMILSGYADLTSIKAAINQGAIYKYLTKPWDDETLRADVYSAFLQFELSKKRTQLAYEIDEANKQLALINHELVMKIDEKDRRIDRIMHYDGITHLPNRSLFVERLQRALAYAERSGKSVAIMMLDLDLFKKINESLGHPVGDKLLEVVAERLQGSIRKEDAVARAGGDEFCFMMSDFSAIYEVSDKAQAFLNLLSMPFLIEGNEVFISFSIGISIYPVDGMDTTILLKNAETAMYHAKSEGRNNFQFYAEQMNASALQRLMFESNLRRALERNEFILHYQPQIYLESGQIFGVEALLRWQHPQRGLIPPSEFIPLLEETGLIIPVGEWIFRTVAAQIKEWQNTNSSILRVAVNLSAVQFRQAGLGEMIVSIMNEVGLDCASGCLEVELTESLVMKDVEGTISVLQMLHDVGMTISIDDFGTGYSSLSYLKRFPIDTLKIDQSFVRNLTIDQNDVAIVTAIIALGHGLKLRVIAEGVETVEQMECLRAMNCDEMQGYLFSKPVPADEVTRLLQQGGEYLLKKRCM